MEVARTVPLRQVRAVYDEKTITVYQAYGPEIAEPALRAGTFVPPFKPDRMTWIKPSFLWMMYRCGWANKPGQERVLAIRITRAGFEEALGMATLSHFDPVVYGSREAWAAATQASPVRVQWDPERDLESNPLPWRSIQIGLSGPAVRSYVTDWITEITDLTDRVTALRARAAGRAALPDERPYPLPPQLAAKVGAT